MAKIYCLEDPNGLKYVGSTERSDIRFRLWEHRSDKKNNHKCSECKLLDLQRSTITLLEECDIENKKVRESYWIKKIKCVNKVDPIGDKKQRDHLRELYVATWGGNKRYENNLLRIDVNLFI